MVDYKEIFKHLSGNYLIIRSNPPGFIMLDASDSHLKTIGATKSDIVGKYIFDVFKDDTTGKLETNVKVIRDSLNEAINKKKEVKPQILRYDIPNFKGDGYETKYWSLTYTPIISEEGIVETILQESIDITDLVNKGLKI